MLGWLIAATPPSMVEASAMKMMIWRQASVAGPIASITTRTSRATAATLGALAKKAATGVGAPSSTSGVHMWKGTALTLKAMPDRESVVQGKSVSLRVAVGGRRFIKKQPPQIDNNATSRRMNQNK